MITDLDQGSQFRTVFSVLASNPVQNTPMLRIGKNTSHTGEIWLFRLGNGYRAET